MSRKAWLGVLAALACGVMVASAQANSAPPVAALLKDRIAGGAGADAYEARMSEPDALAAMYAGRGYSPLWAVNGRFARRGESLLAVLRKAADHGLEPDRYRVDRVERVVSLPLNQYTPDQQVDIELLLSDALLAYLRDLLRGRAQRVELEDSSFNVDENIDLTGLLEQAVTTNRIPDLVDQVVPETPAYARLKRALTDLRSLAAIESRFDLPDDTLHPGDEAEAVRLLRRRLAALGDLPQAENNNRDIFDDTLERAVRLFQARHGLEIDGVVGRETRAALETPISHRVEQVELSLERWRWLPRQPGDRYLVVNIAGQSLDVMENGRSTLHMRVVVGLPFLRTPSFASKIETVVLNPYWEVPYSIAVKEILPKLREDALYLARERMQVLKRGTHELVNPIPIDWNEVPARNFPYRFRQKPGPDNSLGRVKFLMPNPYSVYLHDTPAKTLFSRARRCFSHGCVRLEKPLELADLLLHTEPGWSFERVDKTLETEKNYRIRLTNPMPAYLVYWTAWMDNAGIVHFRDDVYGRDKRLKAALEASKS